jgi:hypothetical protein
MRVWTDRDEEENELHAEVCALDHAGLVRVTLMAHSRTDSHKEISHREAG